jgi:hypothetical protein
MTAPTRNRRSRPLIATAIIGIAISSDVSIDPAGNILVANYWNLEASAGENPSRPTSTWGGGSGFTVIYGATAPVKPPHMGKVQRY